MNSENTEHDETMDFLGTLFAPEDIIMYRPIEIWVDPKGKQSAVDYDGIDYLRGALRGLDGSWRPYPELIRSKLGNLTKRAEVKRSNCFFGVAPRLGGDGEYELAWQIRKLHCLWSDVDDVADTTEVELRIEEAGLPAPSIVIWSGGGVHAYWLLDKPYLIDDAPAPPPVRKEWVDGKPRRYYLDEEGERRYLDGDRKEVPPLSDKAQFAQDVLQGIAKQIGGDATHDLARVLRLPGTLNRKDQRNGRTPVPCHTVLLDATRKYPIDRFAEFAEKSPGKQRREQVARIKLPAKRKLTPNRTDKLAELVTISANAPQGERSDADFNLCCWSIENGVDRQTVWAEVCGLGKFAEKGERYFDATWQAAEDHTRQKIFDRTQAKLERKRKVKPGASESNGKSGSTRPKIDVGCKDLEFVTQAAWEAVAIANDPPELFRYGGVASRVEDGDQGELVVRPLKVDHARHYLARVANWYRERTIKDDTVEELMPPPLDIVKDFLATPNMPLPVLSRFVETPVMLHDGSICERPGYYKHGRVLYRPPADLDVPRVDASPSKADVEKARSLLTEVVEDFPFVSQSELAHALAMGILPFVRELIEGATPLHLIEKPTPGTGATLLIENLAYIALGRPVPAMTEGGDDSEWRKRLTAQFRAGTPYILIDNLRRRLDSAAVASAITSPTWSDRVLQESTMVMLPVKNVWVVTANNPSVSNEISRRSIRIRLDAKTDRPWLREGFKHPDLKGWVHENRPQLIWAALTLARAWVAAGRPKCSTRLGMFESWAETLGGILKVAGIEGFLENLEEFYDESDSDSQDWRDFLVEWFLRFGERQVLVSEIYDELKENMPLHLGDGEDNSRKTRLGKKLQENRDRTFSVKLPHDENGNPVSFDGFFKQDAAECERTNVSSHCTLTLLRGSKFRRANRWKLKYLQQSDEVSSHEDNYTIVRVCEGNSNSTREKIKKRAGKKTAPYTDGAENPHNPHNPHTHPEVANCKHEPKDRIRENTNYGLRETCGRCGKFFGYAKENAG